MAFAPSRFSFASTSKPFTFTGQATNNPPAPTKPPVPSSSSSFSSTFFPSNPSSSNPFSAFTTSTLPPPSTSNPTSSFVAKPQTSHPAPTFTNVNTNPFNPVAPKPTSSAYFTPAPAKSVFQAAPETPKPAFTQQPQPFGHVNTNPFTSVAPKSTLTEQNQNQNQNQLNPFQPSQPVSAFSYQQPFTFQSLTQPPAAVPAPALAPAPAPFSTLAAPGTQLPPISWHFQPQPQPQPQAPQVTLQPSLPQPTWNSIAPMPATPAPVFTLPAFTAAPMTTSAPIVAPVPTPAPAPVQMQVPEPSLFTRIDDNPFKGLGNSTVSVCSDAAACSAVDFPAAQSLPLSPSPLGEKNFRLLAPLPSTSFKPTHHKTKMILSQSIMRASKLDASVRGKLALPSYHLDQFVPCRNMKRLAILPEEGSPIVFAAPTQTRTLDSPPAPQPRRNHLFLSDPGYFVFPSLEFLQTLSTAELGHVENLVIGKTGCGTVKFLEAVDLSTERDLCQTVKFFSRGVDVATKKGLSVPARVRIENCFVREKGSSSSSEPVKDEANPRATRLVQKLKALPNTRFLGYDIHEGIWNFEICPSMA